jgi:hypothetical protein
MNYVNTKVSYKILSELNNFDFSKKNILKEQKLFKFISSTYEFYYNFLDKEFLIKQIVKILKEKNYHINNDVLKFLKSINFYDLYQYYEVKQYKEKLEKELIDKKMIKKNKI